MARQRTCVCCGKVIETGEVSIPYKGRYAHQKCFNEAMKATHKSKTKDLTKESSTKASTKKNKAKPKVELKDGMTEEEYQKKKRYYDYIRQLTSEQELSAKIYALSELYIERYKFTYESMYQTLVYLHEIVEKELTGDIVGVLPYYHTEAQKHLETIQNTNVQNEQVDISKLYKTKTIYIKPPKPRVHQIDISEIGGNTECPS